MTIAAKSELLPALMLPCPVFPCTEKHRPEPYKHSWTPAMIREPWQNHWPAARNMTLADLKLILAALTPEQRAALLTEEQP